MSALTKNRQKGATLLVSMIMLVVLTLLVVFAIRSGNTNLRIAGNMQAQVEANAATQQVIEQVIEQIKATDNIALIPAQAVSAPVGPVTYTVNVEPMANKCLVEVPVSTASLDPSKADDVACFDEADRNDPQFLPGGGAVPKPSACKTQQWEVQANVTDGASGAKVTQVQGVTIRVPTTVSCL